MIPIKLTLQGFLSYRNRVEIDFSLFDLACISGQNGAGKSSLLDAITWALFGVARKRDETLINSGSTAAEVSFTFTYEQSVYRVQRTLPRGKTSILEFQLRVNPENPDQSAAWKPLTERSLRETQSRIEETLHMDYDTFVNASFFLQGKADQFTQQRPADRKRILSSILGLEIWETYRASSAEQRKRIESEIAELDGRLGEINTELAEENPRRARLNTLQEELERLGKTRVAQEAVLENIRKLAASLAEQRKFVEALKRQASTSEQHLEEARSRHSSRVAEQQAYIVITRQADVIKASYKSWQEARSAMEHWEQIAVKFREQERRRQDPIDQINAERVRLQEEQRQLQNQMAVAITSETELIKIAGQIKAVQVDFSAAEIKIEHRKNLEEKLKTAQKDQVEARAENPHLKNQMEELKERITALEAIEGAACPVCGHPLSPEQRLEMIDNLGVEGKELGDRFRANVTLIKESDELVKDLEEQIRELSHAENERLAYSQTVSRLRTHGEQLEQTIAAWQQGLERLNSVNQVLARESFCPEARQQLAVIDQELTIIGYDISAHEAVRRQEVSGRQAETLLRDLERAQAALTPLQREIADLEKQCAELTAETTQQQAEFNNAAASLAASEAQAPDLFAAEADLLNARQQENRLRLEVGAAQQKVAVLEDLKIRRTGLESAREELAKKVGQYKILERAFGKDGVPALLIEQALPQIENKANDILDRLSGGSMSVRFLTQASYKDRKREDLRETLDIQISDGAGGRDYELFSGGEAFRVNFAIRLALAEVLAQRAGARLQTLVIDEGFGSQDTQGRQRLIEAINSVRQDFAKILVITHIDELKDAFPNRIEVEKTEQGSSVRIL